MDLLGVCMQRTISGGSCLNMCLVYRVGLLNMGSMLTEGLKVRKESVSIKQHRESETTFSVMMCCYLHIMYLLSCCRSTVRKK